MAQMLPLRDEEITYNSFRRELETCCFRGAIRLPLIALYKYPYSLLTYLRDKDWRVKGRGAEQ